MALPIHTDRLVIAQPHLCHFEDVYHRVLSQPLVMRYIGDGVPWSRTFAYNRFTHNITMARNSPYGQWTLIEKTTLRIIGQCGLIPIAYRGPCIEIGYRLEEKSWGKGYATEATQALTHYAFQNTSEGGLGLDTLTAVTYPQNHASQKVLVKSGYEYKGITTHWYGTPTSWYQHDCHRFKPALLNRGC